MAKYQQSPIESGRIKFSEPTPRKSRTRPGVTDFVVTITDKVLEESVEKVFGSLEKAQGFVALQLRGPPEPAPSMAPPGVTHRGYGQSTVSTIAPACSRDGTQLAGQHARITKVKGASVNEPHQPFNLRAVKEVLEEYGLDPTAEIAKVLQQTKKVGDKDVDVVGGVDRAKVLTELLQYVSPKLKAVEMKVKDERKFTDAELDARIAALTEKNKPT